MPIVEGTRTFAAPPDRVFAALTDPDVISPALPGYRGFRAVDDDHWDVKIKPPLPLAPAVTIRFEVIERAAPGHAALRAKGGGADVRSSFELAPADGGTTMRWRTDLQLSGVLGRVAGSGLESVAARQAGRMLDAVERALV